MERSSLTDPALWTLSFFNDLGHYTHGFSATHLVMVSAVNISLTFFFFKQLRVQEKCAQIVPKMKKSMPQFSMQKTPKQTQQHTHTLCVSNVCFKHHTKHILHINMSYIFYFKKVSSGLNTYLILPPSVIKDDIFTSLVFNTWTHSSPHCMERCSKCAATLQ